MNSYEISSFVVFSQKKYDITFSKRQECFFFLDCITNVQCRSQVGKKPQFIIRWLSTLHIKMHGQLKKLISLTSILMLQYKNFEFYLYNKSSTKELTVVARKSFGIGGIRLAYVYCLNPCLGGVLGNKQGTIYFSKIF